MEVLTEERESGSRRVSLIGDPVSKTEQSHRKACNINTIVKKARKGQPIATNGNRPLYGDFTGSVDFHTAKNRIIQAQSDFDALPSHIRTRFRNDPAELLEFMGDPDNQEAAIELGLIPQPEKESKPPEEPPTAPEAPADPPGG